MIKQFIKRSLTFRTGEWSMVQAQAMKNHTTPSLYIMNLVKQDIINSFKKEAE